jgi:hypothetical chaperone protein
MSHILGLDFGTTNSSVAVAMPGGPTVLVSFEADGKRTTTFRSVLYFDPEARTPDRKPRAVAGPQAISRYLTAETRGRLMQSLKSHLASRLFRDTSVFGAKYTVEDLIAMILRELRQAARAQFGDLGSRVVVGRPVHFSGAVSAADDALALGRLQRALEQAGFEEVEFEFEPVAAAYEFESQLDHDELILIADFGGGTSDFSLMHVGPSVRGRGHTAEDILGTDGVALAGDTFDGKIVRQVVAPQLGQGSQYRSAFNKVLPVPAWLYSNLERWHYLSFLKSKQTMQMLAELRLQALEPAKITALIHVIEQDLGYHLYRAVEQTKIALSNQALSPLRFRDVVLDLDQLVRRDEFEGWIGDDITVIATCLDRLLEQTGVKPHDVGSVFMTGGSSFVPAVRRLFEARFGAARLHSGGELTSVAKGLALRALDLGI